MESYELVTSDYFVGRDPNQIKVIGEYLKRNHMFRDFCDQSEDPVFSQVSVKLVSIFRILWSFF